MCNSTSSVTTNDLPVASAYNLQAFCNCDDFGACPLKFESAVYQIIFVCFPGTFAHRSPLHRRGARGAGEAWFAEGAQRRPVRAVASTCCGRSEPVPAGSAGPAAAAARPRCGLSRDCPAPPRRHGIEAHGTLTPAAPATRVAPRLARGIGMDPTPGLCIVLFLRDRRVVVAGGELNERKVPDLRPLCLTQRDNIVHVNVRLPSPFGVL